MSKWKILSLKYLKIYLKDQLLRKIQIKCISNQKIMSKKKEMTTLGLVFNQLFLKVSIKKKIHKAWSKEKFNNQLIFQFQGRSSQFPHLSKL